MNLLSELNESSAFMSLLKKEAWEELSKHSQGIVSELEKSGDIVSNALYKIFDLAAKNDQEGLRDHIMQKMIYFKKWLYDHENEKSERYTEVYKVAWVLTQLDRQIRR